MERGEYGYLDYRHRHLLKMALICFAVVAVCIIIGFVIWHKRANAMMIPAVLMVIPAANYLVNYLSVAKYRTAPKEQHDALAAYESAGMLISDLVIIDEKERRSGMDFAVVYKNAVVGYQSRTKDSRDAVEITINDALKRKGLQMRIRVYREWDEFMKRLAEVEPSVDESSERKIRIARDAVIAKSL